MSANPIRRGRWPLIILVVLGPVMARAQDAVNVTVEAASTALYVGQSTVVTVYGEIDPSIEPEADRIFSWYIDVLNSDETVASGYENVETPMSDNHPSTSSDGVEIGPNLRGIHDTFLDQPGAGKASRIELVRFEVRAHAPGLATFSAAEGTTVGGSLSDFLVAQTGGGSFSGGNYAAASVAITVSELDPAVLNVQTVRMGDVATVTFDPVPGFDHSLQWTETLQPGDWIDIPGGPFNAGIFNETVAGVVRRFYRVGATPQ